MAPHTTDSVLEGVDLTGTVAVITGATTGMGVETARALASAGARVVLAGRGPDRLEAAANAIVTTLPTATLETVELDLASLASVRTATAALETRLERIDVLVNNAGVMFTPLERTADGFEMQLGTNHLGHFAWTRLLEPLLVAGAPARVVNLSSAGHKIADIDLEDPGWEHRDYDKFAAYGASKTANVLFTVELDRRLKARGVRSYAVHPGMVATDLARHMKRADFKEMRRMATEAAPGEPGGPTPMSPVSVEQGAATAVWAATSPDLAEVGGVYLADCAIRSDYRPYAVDPERAARLWALSTDLTGA